MMKKLIKKMPLVFVALLVMMMAGSMTAFAEGSDDLNAASVTSAEVSAEDGADTSTGAKASAAAIAIGLAAAAGAIGMGIAIAKSVEGISRQPEAEGKIRTMLMLGLVFIETAIIYALIVAILIIFVL